MKQVVYIGGYSAVDVRLSDRNANFIRGVPKTLEDRHVREIRPDRHWLVLDLDASLPPDLDARKRILIRRSGALGDVIACHGAIQALIAHDPSVRYTLQTERVYADIFSTAPYDVITINDPIVGPFDRVVNLDGLYEMDHQKGGPRDSRTNRTLAMVLGTSTDSDLPIAIFTSRPRESDLAWAHKRLADLLIDPERRLRPLVAVAVRSMQAPRDLAKGLVKEFTERLIREHNCEVLLIEKDKSKVWAGKRIHSFPGSSIAQAHALLTFCDALCTMDSGMLWVGHMVPIPTLAWLGPTPAETKVCHHPLLSQGKVKVLALNDWIECPACYEHASACGFKYACVKTPDRERFIVESIAAVKELTSERTEEAPEESPSPAGTVTSSGGSTVAGDAGDAEPDRDDPGAGDQAAGRADEHPGLHGDTGGRAGDPPPDPGHGADLGKLRPASRASRKGKRTPDVS